MSTAITLCSLLAEKHSVRQVSEPRKAIAKALALTNAADERRVLQRQGLAFYRKYTEAMLRRHMRLSMRVGRMPSLLGQDMFRGKTSTYRISSFDDAVIYVHDMGKCIEKLDAFSQQLITRVALQEYTQGEAAHLLGISLRTVVRRYGDALDDLTQILLERKLMRVEPVCTRNIE